MNFGILCIGILLVVAGSNATTRPKFSELLRRCTEDSKAMLNAVKSANGWSSKLIARRLKSMQGLEKNLTDLLTKQEEIIRNIMKQRTTDFKDCPAPWMFIRKDLCVLLPSLQLNWTDSVKYCKRMGGSSFVFKNEMEYKAVRRQMPKTPCAWTGLKDVGNSTFVRPEGERNSTIFFKWAENQPDSLDHRKIAFKGEKCVATCGSGMIDQPCYYEGQVICQREGVELIL